MLMKPLLKKGVSYWTRYKRRQSPLRPSAIFKGLILYSPNLFKKFLVWTKNFQACAYLGLRISKQPKHFCDQYYKYD